MPAKTCKFTINQGEDTAKIRRLLADFIVGDTAGNINPGATVRLRRCSRLDERREQLEKIGRFSASGRRSNASTTRTGRSTKARTRSRQPSMDTGLSEVVLGRSVARQGRFHGPTTPAVRPRRVPEEVYYWFVLKPTIRSDHPEADNLVALLRPYVAEVELAEVFRHPVAVYARAGFSSVVADLLGYGRLLTDHKFRQALQHRRGLKATA